MLQFTLFSCFNLAGCNPVRNEAGVQSRQVRRRKFGIICPYVWNETEQVQSGIEVTVDDSATLLAEEDAIAQTEVILLPSAYMTSLTAGIITVGYDDGNTVHCGLVFYLPTQLSKRYIADALSQFVLAHHPLHIQVLQTDGLVLRGEDGGELLCEVTADVGDMAMLTSESERELSVIVGPLYALQTFLLGFRMLTFGELAAQSCYFSLMFSKYARIVNGDAVGSSHCLFETEVNTYGSLFFTFGFGMCAEIFLFSNLNLNCNEESVSILRYFSGNHLTDEAKTLCHLHISKIWDAHVLMLPVDIMGHALETFQSCMRFGEFDLVCTYIETSCTILLSMRLRIFGAMLEEILEGHLKIIEGMCGCILRHLVGEWILLLADGVEVVAQLATCQSPLALLVSSLPFRQSPVIGKAATAYGLTKVSPLLVVRNELYAMSECNHRLFLNVVFYCFLYVIQQLLVFVTTAAIISFI